MAFSTGFLVGPLWGGFLVKEKGWDVLVTSLTAVMIAGIPPVLVWTGAPVKWGKRAPAESIESIEEQELKE